MYDLPAELLPLAADGLDGIEIAVRLVEIAGADDVPEVMVRPTIAGAPLRIWSVPLEMIRAER